MKENVFLEIVEAQHTNRLSILTSNKKRRVAGTEDRLVQFKRMAALRKCPVKSVPMDLCTKQFTDLIDMADNTHPECKNIEYLEELIADVQNYLDILLALAIEENEVI